MRLGAADIEAQHPRGHALRLTDVGGPRAGVSRPLAAVLPEVPDVLELAALGLRGEPEHEPERGQGERTEHRERARAAERVEHGQEEAATIALATRSEVSIALEPMARSRDGKLSPA